MQCNNFDQEDNIRDIADELYSIIHDLQLKYPKCIYDLIVKYLDITDFEIKWLKFKPYQYRNAKKFYDEIQLHEQSKEDF